MTFMNHFNRFLLFSIIGVTSLNARENLNTRDNGVKEVRNRRELEREIKASKKPVVCKFYTETCPACVAFTEPYKDLAKSHSNQATFLQANVGESDDLGSAYNVQAIPTTLVFKPGQTEPADTIVGGNGEKIKAAIKTNGNGKTKPTRVDVEEDITIDEEVVTKPAKRPSSRPAILNGNGRVVEIENKAQYDSLVRSGKPVVVEIVTETCHFCKEIRPTLDRLASENSDTVFAIVDKNKLPEIYEEYKDHVRGYPTFCILKNGSLDQSFTGATERSLGPRISSCLGKSDLQFNVVEGNGNNGNGAPAEPAAPAVEKTTVATETRTRRSANDKPVRSSRNTNNKRRRSLGSN